jgi:hypothetical protein
MNLIQWFKNSFKWFCNHPFESIATLIAVAGLFLNYAQLQINHELERAKFLTEYTNTFAASPLQATVVQLEYEKFDFKRLLQKSKQEEDLAKLLDFLNIISYNVKSKHISINDLSNSTLGYAIFVASNDMGVKKYIEEIDNRSLKRWQLPKGTAWAYLREIGPQITNCMKYSKLNETSCKPLN